MNNTALAVAIFIWLSAVASAAIRFSPRLAKHHRSDETADTVRLVAGLFVVMTSLVFGLMINSSKNTFESVDGRVHQYATSLIILDQSLRQYGLNAAEARARLIGYAEAAVATPARATTIGENSDSAGTALNALGDTLSLLRPPDAYHQDLLSDIRAQYRDIVSQRWSII